MERRSQESEAERGGAELLESSQSGESARGGSTKMTREEALEILDLQEGAGTDDIRGAHHRLMLKLHPDQGGSTFLASQINQAKDLLLGL